ncbi:hypothetical protein [Massilia endophytica]|uniref:hypothetical protein n=1 Tax=Massilia endophytica TaxID=2899220 RepID=UPI001E4E3651|nr:hypothetical protein [Massilia endophytica]UGQ48304.1 hypothetical protein LSQ66_07515 [Massilia endophytica]
MNVLKHFEVVFLAAFGIACAANVAYDAAAQKPEPVRTAAASAQKMPVVVITAKRMTHAEKVASLVEEQKHTPAVASL